MQPRPDMKRILVYSHDTFGLGNIRRMLSISTHLANIDEEVSILIISGSPMLHAFRVSKRMDYVKLPSLKRTQEGDYDVNSLGLDFQETLKLRANIILSTVMDFEPDLMLVDKKPYGVANELASSLEFLKRRVNRPKLVLLLRDILDSPKATIPVWQKNGYYDAIESMYDRVLVVGSEKIYDLTEQYKFPGACADLVRYCGYIRRDAEYRPRDVVRAELGVGEIPLILVTAGGGEDGDQLLGCYLDVIRRGSGLPQAKTLLICGPEMSAKHSRGIRDVAAQCPGVLVKEFTDDMISYMNAADLVVSMAGYNTVCEILSLKKRAIVVPRTKPVQEQWIRAQCMSQRGLLRAIHPARLTPDCLRRAIREELIGIDRRVEGLREVDLDGLSNIGNSITALLNQARAPAPVHWLRRKVV